MTLPLVAPVINNNSRTLLGIIQNLNLTSNLNFVLDAADLRSYDGSSQTWTDATGNGNNFFRGTTSGADVTDPTFNGTAGLATEATYFSFDGGDYFTESAAHTFADNWHKNNNAFSIVAMGYLPSVESSVNIWFSNTSAINGVTFNTETGVGAADFVTLTHATTDAASEDLVTASITASIGWAFHGCSFLESGPSCALRFNTTTATPTTTASTSTTANPTVIRIGAQGDASSPLPSGSRLACIAGWSTDIGAAALTNLYGLLKARRFTSLP